MSLLWKSLLTAQGCSEHRGLVPTQDREAPTSPGLSGTRGTASGCVHPELTKTSSSKPKHRMSNSSLYFSCPFSW